MITGYQADWGAQIRAVGTAGTIEINSKDRPPLRIWAKGQTDWQEIPTADNIHGGDAHGLGILDVIDSLRAGREPELSGRKALMATELIFATYESRRKRGRVDLPLGIDDSPYLAILRAT